jgi:hypothetical protein
MPKPEWSSTMNNIPDSPSNLVTNAKTSHEVWSILIQNYQNPNGFQADQIVKAIYWCELAKFMSNYGKRHWDAAMWLLRYIQGLLTSYMSPDLKTLPTFSQNHLDAFSTTVGTILSGVSSADLKTRPRDHPAAFWSSDHLFFSPNNRPRRRRLKPKFNNHLCYNFRYGMVFSDSWNI